MKRNLWFAALLFICISSIYSQDLSVYQPGYFASGADTIQYRIMYPVDYDSSKTYPLVLFLHGAGDRGLDNKKQLSKGGTLFAAEQTRQRYPAIVVFPQCSFFSFWSNVRFAFDSVTKRLVYLFQTEKPPTKSMELLVGLTKNLLDTQPVDASRVYVGGLSMGGMGTFELVNRLPGIFAAAFSICGGANTAIAPNIAKTSWWIFHGKKDPIVPCRLSEEMTSALKQQDAAVKLTLYTDVMHNSWVDAFAEPGLLPWLFSQVKKG